MLKILAGISFMVLAASAEAKDQSPWFGSDAAAPEQISLLSDATVLSASDVVSAIDKLPCPIEGCPLSKKLGKEQN